MTNEDGIEQDIEEIAQSIERTNKEVARQFGQSVIDPILNPSTEEALFVFQTVAGIGGFVGGAIAADRLSNVEDGVLEPGDILVPAGLAIAGSSVSAFLIPTGEFTS